MKYNFDEEIVRSNTDCIKYDALQEFYGTADLLPMWIADMDFKSPPCVTEVLRRRVDHEIFGYSVTNAQWKPAIINWLSRRHGWHVEEQEIGFVGGIVPALAFVLEAFTEVGDKVLMQPPVYHPYNFVTCDLQRVPVTNPLQLIDGQYRIDFDDFERKVSQCKVFFLCNPHNPGGRVWSADELLKMAQICARHKVLVISDEIHSDMPLRGYKHTPFASVGEVAADNCITFMAASKTFNIAGLKSSFHIIHNAEIRDRYARFLRHRELDTPHLFATEAVAAAYNHGEEWLAEMLQYVEANIDYMQQYIRDNMPRLDMIRPQASYLVFLDARGLQLTDEELARFFVQEARVAVNPGAIFGEGGSGFVRINLGCPRATLQRALERIKVAYDKLS
jgi:cystathionine beta-lyase